MKCLKWEGATRCWCTDAGAGSHPHSHSPCARCSLQTYSYLGAMLWWQILFAHFVWHLSYISYQLTVAFFLKHFLPQAHVTPHSTRLPFTSASASFSVSLRMTVHPKVRSSDFLSSILTLGLFPGPRALNLSIVMMSPLLSPPWLPLGAPHSWVQLLMWRLYLRI